MFSSNSRTGTYQRVGGEGRVRAVLLDGLLVLLVALHHVVRIAVVSSNKPAATLLLHHLHRESTSSSLSCTEALLKWLMLNAEAQAQDPSLASSAEL